MTYVRESGVSTRAEHRYGYNPFMRHHLAKLTPALLVGGCSLIYNPNNIDKPADDARIIDMGEVAVDVDIRADTNPIAMVLTEAFPTTLPEGTGDGGSRDGVIVLRGEQFVKDVAGNLAVVLTPMTAGAVTLESFEVSGNGDYIALAVKVPVTADCEDGASVPVKVTVTQNNGIGGTVMGELETGFSVTCLDQLTTAPTATAGLKELYSKIEVGPITIPPGVSSPLILRSASSIVVGDITISGSAREPGPGGGRGALNNPTAANAQPATGPGAGGIAPALSSGGGGGAGYVIPGTMPTGGGAGGNMVGDIWLSSLANNRSSGGGAGAYTGINAGTSGAGGGGGGTVELTAAGTLMVGTISANGGNGGSGSATLGSAGDGAGGSGGTVLLRSLAMMTAGAITVTKGSPGTGPGNAGVSADGRVRADAVSGHPANAQKGPMFVDVPTRVTVQTPPINLTGTMADSTSTMRVFDKANNVVANMTYTPVFGGGSPASAQLMPTLKAGYNRICVWVAGGIDTVPESVNCQTIAFLPP